MTSRPDNFRRDMLDLIDEYEGQAEEDLWLAIAELSIRYVREDDRASPLERELAAVIATEIIKRKIDTQ